MVERVDLEKVQGKIWSAIRAGLSRESEALKKAHEAQRYEEASIQLDHVSRQLAASAIEEAGVEALLSELKSLREALAPFSKFPNDGMHSNARRPESVVYEREGIPLTVADFARARRTIKGGEDG